jgi:hypothetical protein
MHPTSSRLPRAARALAVAASMAVIGAVSACNEFLTADNPAAVPVERLADTSLVDLMANSVIAGIQSQNYFWFAFLGANFTDELRTTPAVFVDQGTFDQRRVTVDNSYNNVFTYSPIQRARWLADSVAGRMRVIYAAGDSATKDLRLARTYAIAGYDLILLAEGWCEAPISSGSQVYAAPSPSVDLFTMAEARFDSAIKIAAQSKAANGSLTSAAGIRFALGADSVRNLAYVGMARAALGRGDMAKAAASARQVAAIGTTNNFEYRLYFNATTTLGLQNLFQDYLSGGGGVATSAISNTPFVGLDDARVPHPVNATGQPLAEPVTGGNFVAPNSPPSFSSFDGTKAGADFTYAASIRLASLLEARYIIAEAEGPTATNIAFVESRRTAFPSTTAATPTTAANFLDNLIEQRRRDFFLDGHRMGDLRRYKKLYSKDFYPTGSYYGSTTVSFGTQMCWPLNVAEVTNNPMVPKPYIPPNGP